MKNLKRAGALIVVLLLLLLYGATFFFAVTDSPDSGAWFRISLAGTIFVPLLLYGYLLVVRFFQKRTSPEESSACVDSIIFDVGMVLVNYDWKSYLDTFPYPREVKERIGQAVFASQTWNEQDRGDLPPDEYVRQFVKNDPQLEKEILQVLSTNERTISVYDYAETWVRYLKEKGFHLYILSNYPERLLEKTRPDMTFLKYMDGIVFSSEVKQIKPEPEIYQALLPTYKIHPRRAVFLDDRQANLDAAAKFGIHTILFHDFKQAAAELKKLGVE